MTIIDRFEENNVNGSTANKIFANGNKCLQGHFYIRCKKNHIFLNCVPFNMNEDLEHIKFGHRVHLFFNNLIFDKSNYVEFVKRCRKKTGKSVIIHVPFNETKYEMWDLYFHADDDCGDFYKNCKIKRTRGRINFKFDNDKYLQIWSSPRYHEYCATEVWGSMDYIG